MQVPTMSNNNATAGNSAGQLQPEDLQLLLKTGASNEVTYVTLLQQNVDVLQGVSKEAQAALKEVMALSRALLGQEA